MLFVRVVRKKLNGKKALLMFEIPKNKHLLKKVFTCTSFCEGGEVSNFRILNFDF